jgi:allophanate hydrolase subunit 2
MEIELLQPALVAVTGGVAELTVSNGPPLGWGAPVVLPAGSRVRVGRLLAGARCYIAVRGGLTRVVGSDGELRIGPEPQSLPATHPASRAEPLTTVRVWPGPRLDWFNPGAWHSLLHTPFRVGDSNRVGVRLVGESLTRVRHGELPSEGLVEGAIQVPPDGQPIVMLADHPTTGGYPVIAVVDPHDLCHVAQAAVGTELRCTLAPAAR